MMNSVNSLMDALEQEQMLKNGETRSIVLFDLGVETKMRDEVMK